MDQLDQQFSKDWFGSCSSTGDDETYSIYYDVHTGEQIKT